MIRAMAALLCASCLLAVSGPVGDAILIDGQAQPSFGYRLADLGFVPADDRYVSFHVDGTQYGGDTTLRGVAIDPDTGDRGSYHDIAGMIAIGPVAAAWNPGAKVFLVTFTAFPFVGGGKAIYGCLAGPNGAATGSPFLVSGAASVDLGRDFVRVACDGSAWMVVWQESLKNSTKQMILARPVSADGTAGTPEILVSATERWESLQPAIAFGAGEDYLVAWQDRWRTPSNVYTHSILGRTLSPDGIELGPVTQYDDSVHPKDDSAPSLAAIPTTGEFLLGWMEQEHVSDSYHPGTPLACRVDAAGLRLTVPAVVDGYPRSERRTVLGGSLSFAWNRKADQVMAAWIEGRSIWAARLDAADLSLLERDILIADSVDSWNDLFGAPPSSASRDLDFQVIFQWRNVSGFTGTDSVQAQRYDLGPGPRAPQILAPEQLSLGAVPEPIAAGAETVPTGFKVTATLDSPAGLPSVMEVEVRESGVPFSGRPTHTSTVAADGASATVTISGLARSKGYHWQIRAIDGIGRASAWTGPGGDPDLTIRPNTLAMAVDPRQLDAGSLAPIALGRRAMIDTVRFSTPVNDNENDDSILEIEVRPLGTPFSGVPTAATSWIADDGTASLDIPLAMGAHHWQYRLIDATLEVGAWIPFGGNAEEEADFILIPAGSSNGRPCGQSAAGAAWPPALALILLLLRRTAR